MKQLFVATFLFVVSISFAKAESEGLVVQCMPNSLGELCEARGPADEAMIGKCVWDREQFLPHCELQLACSPNTLNMTCQKRDGTYGICTWGHHTYPACI